MMAAGGRTNMALRIALALALGVLAATAAAEDVPFVTTPDNVTLAMLKLANVGKRDYVIDLGSGDGRIVILAAKRFGARGLGVEIVPELVARSRDNAKLSGVEARAEFREQDLFEADLARATVVTLYLLPDVNLQLRPKLLALKPGTRIVSHDWDMGEWKPDESITLDVPDKKIGREKTSRVHLWIVPARIEGAWCGTGEARGRMLTLAQNFQQVRGELADGAATQPFEGRIEADVVRGLKTPGPAFELKLNRKPLVMTQGGPRFFSSPRAVAFARRKGDS